MRVPPAPLFLDPEHHAPTDPCVVRGPDGPGGAQVWWMFYTQRRVYDDGPGVSWVHGTDIGVATSDDGGLSWRYRGVVENLDPGPDGQPGRNTFWAPEVVRAGGMFHMFVSLVPGVPATWEGHRRHVLHHVSEDLVTWELRGRVPLSSDRVIDACVARHPGGGYRLWYKDEAAGARTYRVDSLDLEHWGEPREAVAGPPHEGANVFWLGGWWWLLVDEWRGQAAYRSRDLDTWERDRVLLDAPGVRPFDQGVGNHADVVVGLDPDGREVAWIFYFVHRMSPWTQAGRDDEAACERGERVSRTRFAAVQVAQARVVDGRLVCDRDEPFDLDLRRAVDADDGVRHDTSTTM